VIVESISRPSRNSSGAFRVEDELRSAGVRLCAANEPVEGSFDAIALRHVNIGIARGYHHELMVQSRQGQETSTRQGWHTPGASPSTGTASSPTTTPTRTRRAAGSRSAPWSWTPCAPRSCATSNPKTSDSDDETDFTGQNLCDEAPGPVWGR
jgi:hypothetical protein